MKVSDRRFMAAISIRSAEMALRSARNRSSSSAERWLAASFRVSAVNRARSMASSLDFSIPGSGNSIEPVVLPSQQHKHDERKRNNHRKGALIQPHD